MIKTPDCRKSTQMCYTDRIKPYYERGNTEPVLVVQQSSSAHKNVDCSDGDVKEADYNVRLCNSEVLSNLDVKLAHLSPRERKELTDIIMDHKCLFPDVTNRTTIAYHDVDVDDATPIKQHPYRVGPQKAEVMQAEIAFMLENGVIERSRSSWTIAKEMHLPKQIPIQFLE